MGLSTTAGLIERLVVDRALRRICGFPRWKKLPDESTFSRAFAEFAADGLAERTNARLKDDFGGRHHFMVDYADLTIADAGKFTL